MNIAIIAKKGGVGKSLISILLEQAFTQAGKTVFIHDWDPQGTSTKAMHAIYAGQHNQDRDTAEITIWDTPPNLEHTATATAVRGADIILVITSPAPADMWEARDAVKFAASKKNPKAALRVAVTEFRRTTLLGKLLEEQTKDLSAALLPVMLSDRECYKHAIAQGWRSLDSAAREEVLQFALSLLSLK